MCTFWPMQPLLEQVQVNGDYAGPQPELYSRRMRKPPDAWVLFGAMGDLAHRKIFPALDPWSNTATSRFPMIGVGKSWSE
jgi:glucose-6-phosphate dehydrogenase-like protein